MKSGTLESYKTLSIDQTLLVSEYYTTHTHRAVINMISLTGNYCT